MFCVGSSCCSWGTWPSGRRRSNNPFTTAGGNIQLRRHSKYVWWKLQDLACGFFNHVLYLFHSQKGPSSKHYCNYTELYLCPVQHERTNFVFEAPKAVIRDVFSWSYCCYGNLLCQVNYVCISMCSPLIGQFYRYHDCTIKWERVVIMAHRNLASVNYFDCTRYLFVLFLHAFETLLSATEEQNLLS